MMIIAEQKKHMKNVNLLQEEDLIRNIQTLKENFETFSTKNI